MAECKDPNIHRWFCYRGLEGAEPGMCPLAKCALLGANREEES